MPEQCTPRTSGGKGNLGKFIEREPNIFAAGVVTASHNVAADFQQYSLQDQVDALLGEAIIPLPKLPSPRPRHPLPKDMRNSGFFNQARPILNPPIRTKFQHLVENFKESSYSSFWNRPVGARPDRVALLPEGFDSKNTCFGKKNPNEGSLYDLVFPPIPSPDKTPRSKVIGVKTRNNYCQPAFDPERLYGCKSNQDPRGTMVRCCLTDDRVKIGTAGVAHLSSRQADFNYRNHGGAGVAPTPNNNIASVPEGFSFGKVQQSELWHVPDLLTTCKIKPERHFFLECLGHLNTVRKCMSKRYETTFFRKFYKDLKYLDTSNTGWLPKQIVYDACTGFLIRLESTLIEPLLTLWKAFDGSCIEYETFVRMLNFKNRVPDFPKIEDVAEDCLDFRTTYSEMVKPGKEIDLKMRRAGLPSGRYLDTDYPVTPHGYCRAHQSHLPHETDTSISMRPSILTNLGVSHREMFAIREPQTVRRVFEAAGDKFTDEQFEIIWNEATKYHSKGFVCYETFRRALDKYQSETNKDNQEV